MGSTVQSVRMLKEIYVGSVKLSRGSWFMCRAANDLPDWWFGRVVEVVLHKGADDTERALVRAEWFTGATKEEAGAVSVPICDQILAPVVASRPANIIVETGPWYLPEAIVPWPCHLEPHPGNPNVQVALARHWHILRNLFPYPTVADAVRVSRPFP